MEAAVIGGLPPGATGVFPPTTVVVGSHQVVVVGAYVDGVPRIGTAYIPSSAPSAAWCSRMTEALNELERSVLQALAERNPACRAVLEAQLASARVRQRENTGGGFYTEFEIPSEQVLQFAGAPIIDGSACRIDGLKNPMVFILFTADGYLDFLEGAAIDESTLGVNFDDAPFKLIAN